MKTKQLITKNFKSAAIITLLIMPSIARAELIADGSFEVPDVPLDTLQYHPTGSAWTFSELAGIVETTIVDSTPVAEPPYPTPDGSQIAVLQSTPYLGSPLSEFAQPITFGPEGRFELSYFVAGGQHPTKPYFPDGSGVDGNLRYVVLLDNVPLFQESAATFQPWTRRDIFFDTSPGNHILAFRAIHVDRDSHGGFFDALALSPSAVPDALPNGVFVAASAAILAFHRRMK